MTSLDRARMLRKRHVRERQAILLGSVVAALAVLGAGAAAVLTNKVELDGLNVPFVTSSASADASSELPPCLTPGTLPIAYSAVSINVLNGTQRPGLAKATADALTLRAFTVLSTGDATTAEAGVSRVIFGNAGIAQAYTLAAHLPKATMVLDPRTDASVDLIVGAGWTGLTPLDSVSVDPNVPLISPKSCVPIADLVAKFPKETEPPVEDGDGSDTGDEPVDPASDQG